MRLVSCSLLALAALGVTAVTAAERPIRFWNLTAYTITSFQLAPVGTDKWGANQTSNDPDGTVDSDERLNISGIGAGTYDAKFTDKRGRTCVVKNVTVKAAPEIFSIEEKELDPKLCMTK